MQILRVSPILIIIYILGIGLNALFIYAGFKWFGYTVGGWTFAAFLGATTFAYISQIYKKLGYTIQIGSEYITEKFYGETIGEEIPLSHISEVRFHLYPILQHTVEGVQIIYPGYDAEYEGEILPPLPVYPINIRKFLEALLTIRPDCAVDEKLAKYLPEQYRNARGIKLRWWRFITLKNILFGIIYLFLIIFALAFFYAFIIEPRIGK